MSKIKYLIMDVDGTLTDGKIYMGEHGEVCKAFDIKDGCGISILLPQIRVKPVIITARKSSIVENRCKELGITEIYQGVPDKAAKLVELLATSGDDYGECAYIGDDIIDLPCMTLIKNAGGIVGCPADAVEKVKHIADFVAKYNGGNGAVRNFIEYLIKM